MALNEARQILSVFKNYFHPRRITTTEKKLMFIAFPASDNCTRFAESLNAVFPG